MLRSRYFLVLDSGLVCVLLYGDASVFGEWIRPSSGGLLIRLLVDYETLPYLPSIASIAVDAASIDALVLLRLPHFYSFFHQSKGLRCRSVQKSKMRS